MLRGHLLHPQHRLYCTLTAGAQLEGGLMKNISNHLSEEEQIQVGYGPVYDLCISIAFLILFVVGKQWGVIRPNHVYVVQN